MSKFDRYVLSQLLVLFGFFSLILVAVYWINQAVLVFDQLISDGQTAGTVLAFTALSLPFVNAIVMPMSAFAAAVYVTNRLNSESELVVMQATGFSPYRLALPYLIFGVLVAIMTSVLFHILVPAAARETDRQTADIANNVTARFLSPGEFFHPTSGVTFYIGEITPDGVLRGIFFTDARNKSEQTTYIAKEAFLLADQDQTQLVMVDGIAQTLTTEGRRLSVTRFNDFAYDIGRLIEAVSPSQSRPRQIPTPDLLRSAPELAKKLGKPVSHLQWEAHNRISQSLLSVFTTLIGFSTLLIGAFSRFGIWRQILAAAGLMIVLKMIDNTASSYARATEDGWPAQYVALVVSALVCWGLLAYAARTRRLPPAQPIEATT